MILRWMDFDLIRGTLFWTRLGREKGGVMRAYLWRLYVVEVGCMCSFDRQAWECSICIH